MEENHKKHIKFFRGYTFINEIPCFLLPLSINLFLYENIKDNKLYATMKEERIQEIANYLGSNIVNRKIATSHKISLFLKQIKYFGYGEFRLISISKDKIIILNNSPIFLNELYGSSQNKSTSLFIEEMILHFLQFLLNKNITILSNYKNRQQLLTFTLHSEKTKKTDSSILAIKDINTPGNANRLLLKILAHQDFKISKGGLTIWNVKIATLPLHLFSYSSKKQELAELMTNIGIKQGEIATEFQIKSTGKREPKHILNSILQESEFVGMGISKNPFLDEKNLKYSFELYNNFLANNYLKDYALGIFIGIMETLYKMKAQGSTKGNLYTIRITQEKLENEKKPKYLNLKKIIKT